MAQLFVGQLPFNKFFSNDLLELFSPYGTVIAYQLHICQGNAFVTYATTDEADRAILALHERCVVGTRNQPIQVMYSKRTQLISAFGFQHRSKRLALNADRTHSKEEPAPRGADHDHYVDTKAVSRSTSPSFTFANVAFISSSSSVVGGVGGCREDRTATGTPVLSSYGDIVFNSEPSSENYPIATGSGTSGQTAAQPHCYPHALSPKHGHDGAPLPNIMRMQGPYEPFLAAPAAPLSPGMQRGGPPPTAPCDLANPVLPAPPTPMYVVVSHPRFGVPCLMPVYYTVPPSAATVALPASPPQPPVLMSTFPCGQVAAPTPYTYRRNTSY